MDAADIEFMTRLFGPRICGSEKQLFEIARFVGFQDDYHAAMDALVSSVIYNGIGRGVCVGWSFTEDEDGLSLSICRLREAMAA